MPSVKQIVDSISVNPKYQNERIDFCIILSEDSKVLSPHDNCMVLFGIFCLSTELHNLTAVNHEVCRYSSDAFQNHYTPILKKSKNGREILNSVHYDDNILFIITKRK